MSRKNKKSKELNSEEKMELPAAANEDLTESTAAAQDTSVSDAENVEERDVSAQEESPVQATSSESASDLSPDDILDDVRRSLIEDEAAENAKQTKWWQRIGKGSRKEEAPVEEPKVLEEIDLPAVAESSPLAESETADESDEYVDQIDELIDLLDHDDVETHTPSEDVPESPAETEKIVDINELKKQAFQPRTANDTEENLSEVRSIALDGDEEVFVEVESKPQDPLEERISAVENALKPYQKYINLGLAFLGVVIAVLALGIIYSVYQKYRPAPVVEDVSGLPFPSSVSLPGGWVFKLGKGTLKDGRWNPQGAEWLEGTEVCRWVSLPWSRQLEAVVRTLNPDDPIELGMSNSDKLMYKVYSIRQMSADELQQLDSNSPCLLIILTDRNAEKSWVLTALP